MKSGSDLPFGAIPGFKRVARALRGIAGQQVAVSVESFRVDPVQPVNPAEFLEKFSAGINTASQKQRGQKLEKDYGRPGQGTGNGIELLSDGAARIKDAAEYAARVVYPEVEYP